MKRFLSTLLLITMIFSLSACGTVKNVNDVDISKQDSAYINKAINVINKKWKEIYSQNSDRIKTDKTVEIINTRVIHIKENDVDEFKNIEAVVEFDILSDYFGSAPYYVNTFHDNSVVFYKDGSSKVIDIFRIYRAQKYITDFSNVIENIVECGTAFNTNKIKTKELSSNNEKYITGAIELIKSKWKSNYQDADIPISGDGTLKIINTKLLIVSEQSQYYNFEQHFGDIEAIVEFELYSDYFGSAPYYMNVAQDNTVVFHKDGKTEVSSNYISHVASSTYDYNFSEVFTDMIELGSKYNEDFNLLDNKIAPLDDDYSNAVDSMN